MPRQEKSVAQRSGAPDRPATEPGGAPIFVQVDRAAENARLLRSARRAITVWEKEHGEISEGELQAVERVGWG